MTTIFRTFLFLACCALTLSGTAVHAGDGDWALDGYDPVALFDDGVAEPGRSDLLTEFRGETYHFTTEMNLTSFESNPRIYMPQFGGLSVVALSHGHEAEGNPETFVIYGDTLFLMQNEAERREFMANPGQVIAAAQDYLAGRQ